MSPRTRVTDRGKKLVQAVVGSCIHLNDLVAECSNRALICSNSVQNPNLQVRSKKNINPESCQCEKLGDEQHKQAMPAMYMTP